ncbi:MAG: hypothetical protein HY544_05195 [Candidatus Diapherotrites archaeon]|uniref:Uncharacterized protein n=1 Tax=Candidatus Iainarchaeum sp. TaxID=3101447 RepID=A0A8T3YM62_9ARCH|nr:hypothetical protein [Candidatus Diapherotrites archaeon]
MKRFLLPLFITALSAFAAAESLWEGLRPVTGFAKDFELPIKGVVMVCSLAVFIISMLAYRKSGSRRILLVSVAFGLLALKWLVKITDVMYSPGYFLSDASDAVFELLVIASLLVAIFYRKNQARFFASDAEK